MSESIPDTTPCRIVLTMGDPAGIGPELCVRLMDHNPFSSDIAVTVVGSAAVLRWIEKRLDFSAAFDIRDKPTRTPGQIALIDCGNATPEICEPPAPTRVGGQASLTYIHRAVEEIQADRADVLVTSPINKKAISAAGSRFPGHTEMLGEMSNTPDPVMMLLNDQLRVTFATKHVAVNRVASQLRALTIQHTAESMAESLNSDFHIETPRIGVCALNPHAGDGGRFGDEEEKIIRPAIEHARASGHAVDGPYPSDTLFVKALNGEFDGIVAMYHDQGMIPIKLSGVGGVVNATLGLPFVRTSPGHGTAYDIAGTGVADPSATISAVQTAVRMYRARAAH